MRWEGDEQSSNVEDRRGDSGGGGGFGLGGGSLGIGAVVVALLGSWFFGVSPSTILNVLSGGGGSPAQVQQQAPSGPPATDRESQFVRTVLRYTETTWGQIFQANGAKYQPPVLVLYTGRTGTGGCGTGQSAVGPFYCPADRKVYIDLSFFKLMQQRFHVSGEFTQAYVIAHEVGHHVQNLLGISGKVDNARQQLSESQGNALSVRVELQADCFAGVWANHTDETKRIIQDGDVESALAAASAIGDDALQRQARGEVVPDSFTHGTSAQRMRWFKKGLDSGSVEQCNTFEARQL
ncbi:KPN_02809 family neutral zinc metallopeptidase [Massilia phyllosphaerae]|uniref:KPN_02809 family neutral zinc metallopeptidase n=1 Tax=Massilia phyllosphaerae TaxID=3106034 RepID=UPI002B1CE19D|nr:neutral zinc metallopeptidase [Massilia sp. SGZ-792]